MRQRQIRSGCYGVTGSYRMKLSCWVGEPFAMLYRLPKSDLEDDV